MYRTIVLVLLAALALPGCGDGGDDVETQIPNPASVFCEEQGGIVRIETAADGGQSGVCVLQDGTEVDEWEFYRANTSESSNG
ncbi:MAG: DUF333 domain-containing protein [Acidimicrobiia bacterium]